MSQSRTPFHVVAVVWGRRYVESFLDVVLPNQATPRNLGALPAGSRYRVFTAPEDADVLAASPALGRVNGFMPVDLVVMPELSQPSVEALARLTMSHVRALADAREARAALIFLAADHVISEGTLAAVVRRHEGGSRAVVCAGVRLTRETFVAALARRGGRPLLSRELVSLALEHLHPFTRLHMVDGDPSARRPIHIYWNVPAEGILARCFYMHPLMVDPVRHDVMLDGTIDQHYLAHAVPRREQVHVVSDSDELAVFEMSPVDGAVTETAPGSLSVWVAAKVLSRCDSHQRSYWAVPIRLHGGDLGPAWGAVERQSARFARRVGWLRPAGRFVYVVARRFRPYRRRFGAFRRRLRDATKPLEVQRIRRSASLAARPMQKVPRRVAQTGRRMLHRTRRSLGLLAHSGARLAQKIRKRTARAGRRVWRRPRAAH